MHLNIKVSDVGLDQLLSPAQLHMRSGTLLIAFVHAIRLVRINAGPHSDSGVYFTLYLLSEGYQYYSQ